MNTNYELRSPCAALITTAFELPGFQIVKSYGIVCGIIVRSRFVIGNIGTGNSIALWRQHHPLYEAV